MYTSPDIDLILLGEDTLQIRFPFRLRDSLNLKGESASRIYGILNYCRTLDSATLTQYKEEIGFLHKHDLLVDRLTEQSTSVLPRCFIPFEVAHNLWAIRVDSRVYMFSATTPEEIIFNSEKVARSCSSKEDRQVFLKIFDAPIEVKISPSTLHLDKTDLGDARYIEAHNKVNCTIGLKLAHQDSTIRLSIQNLLMPPADGNTSLTTPWSEIIKYAKNQQIITSLTPREMSVSELTGVYVPHGYSSSYLLPSLKPGKFQFSFGAGLSPMEAAGKSCMEAIERLYSQQPIQGKICSQEQLRLQSISYIPVEQFINFLPQQISFFKLETDNLHNQEINWLPVLDVNQKTHFAPSAVCYYGDYTTHLEKSFFFNSCSNGCAAHLDQQKAILSGIQECVERDAIMLWWYNRLPPPYIAENTLPDNVQRFLNEEHLKNYEVRVLDLTLDTMPVILFVARNKQDCWPYFVCGSSCNTDYSTAIQKAFSEFYLAFSKTIADPPKSSPTQESVSAPLDHEAFYLDPKNKKTLSFLFKGERLDGQTSEYTNLEIDRVFRLLDQKIGPIFYHELGKLPLNQKEQIFVVKAIIPKLIPIAFGYLCDHLAHERIYELPVKLNLKKTRITKEAIWSNYSIHFFP